MKIAGIDEAGKGAVIGTMCIAGVKIDSELSNALKNLGVKDSKKISKKKREQLAYQIKKYSDECFILEVESKQIDELRSIMTMNNIMEMGFSKVLLKLVPDKAFVDSIDVNADRFGKLLTKNFTEKIKKPIEIISEHRADETYPIVSAASIIAKVRRDELIDALKNKIGMDFGSGYPSDPKTKKYIADCVKKNNSLPDFVRHSWKTAENALNLGSKRK